MKCKVANQLAYYSGHYDSYGVNCQATVKSNLEFLNFGIVAPGSTNDSIVFPTAGELILYPEDASKGHGGATAS